MTDYGDAKLPDPPAYDPRVERADAAEEIISRRAAALFDMAVHDKNMFVSLLLIFEITQHKGGKELLEELCQASAIRLQDRAWSRYFPQDVRDAVGLDD